MHTCMGTLSYIIKKVASYIARIKMKLVLAILSVFLILICTTSRCSESTSNESLFIVTLHNSGQCPQRFLGEPCLTLQQFFSFRPRKCSNATLMLVLESGSHFVCGGGSISFYCSTGLNFAMTAEDANILTYCPFQLSIHITTTGYTHINGITFTSSNIHNVISIRDAQEVIVSDCNFVGTAVSLGEVINAIFLRCTFSNNRRALSIYESTVSIVQCNFTKNDFAIMHTMYSYIQPRSLYIRQSAFINNRASETFDKSGAAIFIKISHYYDYVSTYVNHHFLLYIWDSTFINNTSKYTGGAVYISGDWSTLSIHHSTFINNTAGTSAGAIHVTGGNTSLSLTENTFIHNSANRCGALSINKVRDINITEIAHNIFGYNSALSEIDNGGGAMCIKGSSSIAVHVTNCTFFSNEANTYGGAIALYTATTTISGSVFTHNTAGYNGGAVSVNILHDNCTFTGNAFSSNWAHNDGGAISVSHSGTFSIEMCNFMDNVASNRGGAIVLHRSTMEITGTHMHNNLARIGRDINSCNSNVTSDTKFRRDNDCSYHVNANTSVNMQAPQHQCLLNTTTFSITTYDGICIELSSTTEVGSEVSGILAAAYMSITLSTTLVLTGLMYMIIGMLIQKFMNREMYAETTQDHVVPHHESV